MSPISSRISTASPRSAALVKSTKSDTRLIPLTSVPTPGTQPTDMLISATVFSRLISAGGLATGAEIAAAVFSGALVLSGDAAVSRRVVAVSSAASTSAFGAPGVWSPDGLVATVTGRLDFTEPSTLDARDGCTRALTPVFDDPVRDVLVVAFGPGDDAAEARSAGEPPGRQPSHRRRAQFR